MTDTYQADGATTDLGVITVIDGGLNTAQTIAPGVSFNLGINAGGGGFAVGGRPSNDTYRSAASQAIRITGVAGPPTTKVDDGVGMHADELITFDLLEIRSAGSLSTFASYFTAKGGINDSAFPNGNLRTVVIVSDDSGNVLAGYINGERRPVSKPGAAWQFDSAPSSLTGSGVANRSAPFAVPIPPEARYLTLATTSGGDASSDHGVFSGASWDSHAIPLSNLFDDPNTATLATAIATDTFRAAAEAGDLGVDRVIDASLSIDQTIAPGVVFNLATAGGTVPSAGGLPGNDSECSSEKCCRAGFLRPDDGQTGDEDSAANRKWCIRRWEEWLRMSRQGLK